MGRSLNIRPEEARDHGSVHQLTRSAFAGSELGYHGEAELVDALRAACPEALSLVAEDGDGTLVGHILFTPALIEDESAAVTGMGLAPMSVAPFCQGQGVGSALVRHGLAELEARSVPFVVVLGHGEYYPRFGFERASRHGVECEFPGVPDELFMIRIFDADAVRPGTARYHAVFHDASHDASDGVSDEAGD